MYRIRIKDSPITGGVLERLSLFLHVLTKLVRNVRKLVQYKL